MNPVIYKLTNKINNKIYIGQTINFNRRMNEYKNRKPIKTSKYKIMEAINKYGFENFTYEIIHVCDNESQLDYYENLYINKYMSYDDNIGYNSKHDNTLSESTKLKMSKSHIGLKESAETKRKKSNKIIAIRDGFYLICDSAKLFGDLINKSKDKVKNALRMPCRILDFYVFYYDYDKRHEILHKSKNEEYISLCKIIDEEDVETIENLFDVFYIKYDE